MEERSASIEEWKQYNEQQTDGGVAPLHFRLTGSSMTPLLRNQVDEVTVLPCRRAIKTGDIVLFKAKNSCGNFILHRVIKVDGGKILTMGDGNLAPDGWISVEAVYGVAVWARRGKRTLHLQGIGLKCFGRLWICLRPMRPLLAVISRWKERISAGGRGCGWKID